MENPDPPTTNLLKEVRFSYQHDNCWVQETSEAFPTLTLVASSIYLVNDEIHVDVFVHGQDPNEVRRAAERWKHDDRVLKVQKLYEGPRGTRFHITYTARHSIYPYILHHTPISVGVASISGGTEYYHIVGEPDDVQGLIAKLKQEGHLTITSIRNLQQMPETGNAPSGNGLIDGLSDKQIEALVLAHQHGYYQWPRRLSATKLAQRVGLSSSAFLDHLRHAEAKALDHVIGGIQESDPARYEAVKTRLSQEAVRARAAKPS